MLLGKAGNYEYLNDIPRKHGPAGDRRLYDTISIVPFCQIKERGFEVHDEGEKIRTILVDKQTAIFKNDLVDLFPSRQIHLSGVSDKDIFELFSDSMFAATVVGSPVENACRIIKKYTGSSRRYYGSALMLVGRDPDGSDYLDSPITIRTLEIDTFGTIHFSTGATLVKDSIPAEEVRETAAKSRAILRPLRPTGKGAVRPPLLPSLANDDDIIESLNRRNQGLSDFWFFQQDQSVLPVKEMGDISLTLIDNGDDFIFMLRHIFSALGIDTRIVSSRDYDIDCDRADITLLGPGPGNPNNESDEKIRRNMAIAGALLHTGKKSLFICLGHHILCRCLGYPVRRKDKPLQGCQLEIDLFGAKEKVGFYNTFAARIPAPDCGYDFATLADMDELAGIRGEKYRRLSVSSGIDPDKERFRDSPSDDTSSCLWTICRADFSCNGAVRGIVLILSGNGSTSIHQAITLWQQAMRRNSLLFATQMRLLTDLFISFSGSHYWNGRSGR